MRHYHHIGIPTEHPRPDERYLPDLKLYVSGYEMSEYGIEWMRFESDCPLPELVKTVPHVAFRVDDLQTALQGQDVLIPPNSPSSGIRVAFIVENGAPIEFLEELTEGLPRDLNTELLVATTTDVLEHHLQCFGAGDLDGILSDYAEDAVLFTPDGPLIGIDMQSPNASIAANDLKRLRSAWGAEPFDAAWQEATGEAVPDDLKESDATDAEDA